MVASVFCSGARADNTTSTVEVGTYANLYGNTGDATAPTDATSNSNKLTLGDSGSGPTITDSSPSYVSGGETASGTTIGTANNNQLIINAGTNFSGSNTMWITGGYVDAGSGTASNNTVTINQFVQGTGDVLVRGGHAAGTGNVSGNNATISASNTNIFYNIYGGQSINGALTGNTVTIEGGTIIGDSVYGGYGNAGNAGGSAGTGNIVNITGGSVAIGGNVMGGNSNSGFASYNQVNIGSGYTGTIGGLVSGGYVAAIAGAEYNKVTIAGGTLNNIVRGGYSYGGAATHNEVIINGGSVNDDIHGGRTTNGSATDNTVTITTTNKTYQNIYGGSTQNSYGTTGDLFTGNTLNLTAGNTSIASVQNMETINFTSAGDPGITTLDTTVRGATGTPLVKLNTDTNNVTFGTTSVISGSGGIEKTGAGILALAGTNTYTGNTTVNTGTLEVTGTLGSGNYAGTIKNDGTLVFNQTANQTLSGAITGSGSLTKNGTGNLTLAGANTYTGDTTITGGGNVAVTGTLGGGSYAGAIGINHANSALVMFQNTDQTLSGDISGAGSLAKDGTGTLTLSGNNPLYTGATTINGGTLQLNNANAAGTGTSAITTATDATLALNFGNGTVGNGTFSRDVNGSGNLTVNANGELLLSGTNTYTGMTTVGSGTLKLGSDLASNKLTLNNGTTFDRNNKVHSLSGGSLTVNGSATYTGDLDAQNATLNFIAPVNISQPMLKVTGDADVSNSFVNVGVSGGTSLPTGTELQLLNVTGTLTGAETLTEGSGIVESGVTTIYGLTLAVDPVTGNLVGKVSKAALNPQTKSFSESRLSQLAFVNQGSDLIAGQGLSAALDATANHTERRTTTFGAISGGSSRYKTGSHSDVTGVSLITGLAGNSRLAHGKLTLGAFFEYGNANYDSYNSFVNAANVRGKGGINYTGGGVLAHFEFNPTARGNAWLESSARFGRATVDFKTGDMFDLSSRQHPAFASDSNYAAAHIGLGYHWNLTKQNGFDLYAQYLWSRQNADTAELTTGETIRFETANSERLRLGSRFVYNLNPHRRAYAGIAWEHEYDGAAEASIYGYSLDVPKLTGDTCKLELGLTLQPTKTCPFTRNLGIQGYTGKREGVAGSVEVRYEF